MSELKVIYLGPACQEQGKIDGREWCQDDVWDACECEHESVRYVLGSEFDRVTAERDALQQRLNAADQRIDELAGTASKALDVLRDLLREKACGVHYAAAQMACHQINAAIANKQ